MEVAEAVANIAAKRKKWNEVLMNEDSDISAPLIIRTVEELGRNATDPERKIRLAAYFFDAIHEMETGLDQNPDAIYRSGGKELGGEVRLPPLTEHSEAGVIVAFAAAPTRNLVVWLRSWAQMHL
jgi:hypothetical protein